MLCWPIGGNPWKDTKIKPPNLNLGAGCNKGQSPKGCWKSRADAVVGFPLPPSLPSFSPNLIFLELRVVLSPFLWMDLTDSR